MRKKRELEQLSGRVPENEREEAATEACVGSRSVAVAFRQGEREDASKLFLVTAVVSGMHSDFCSDFFQEDQVSGQRRAR